eukprot:3456793-Ditylum_brightwellii.AAC.1
MMCEAGWQVDCMAKPHGGLQSIWFPNGDNIPLEYDANIYKLYVDCRCSSTKELKTIPFQWIECHVKNLEIDKGMKACMLSTSSTSISSTDP